MISPSNIPIPDEDWFYFSLFIENFYHPNTRVAWDTYLEGEIPKERTKTNQQILRLEGITNQLMTKGHIQMADHALLIIEKAKQIDGELDKFFLRLSNHRNLKSMRHGDGRGSINFYYKNAQKNVITEDFIHSQNANKYSPLAYIIADFRNLRNCVGHAARLATDFLGSKGENVYERPESIDNDTREAFEILREIERSHTEEKENPRESPQQITGTGTDLTICPSGSSTKKKHGQGTRKCY
jgi:hypothetical protein